MIRLSRRFQNAHSQCLETSEALPRDVFVAKAAYAVAVKQRAGKRAKLPRGNQRRAALTVPGTQRLEPRCSFLILEHRSLICVTSFFFGRGLR
jgi:hypothetical protein